jgi:hypothetical protein
MVRVSWRRSSKFVADRAEGCEQLGSRSEVEVFRAESRRGQLPALE